MDTNFSNKKILIVEAFKVFRDIIKQASLSLKAEQVDVCTNSKDAITFCKANQYDIIFMGYDLGENKRNGQQTLEELRVSGLLKRTCNFILITAESSQEMVLCALEHKPDCYLTKPFTTKELLKRLFQVMHKKHTLKPIYDALDDGDSLKAIMYCNKHIHEQGKYIDDCLGIKSRQLFEQGKFEQAKEIYELKKDDENCHWASIGLGKVCLELKDYATAANEFKAILKKEPKYISAYEWLAKAYQAMGEYDQAEKTLERAVETSPRSMKLMQKFAAACEQNGKYEDATLAYNRALDLAKNSIHHSAERAFDFARIVTDHAKDFSPPKVKEFTQKALKEIADASKEFASTEVRIKSNLASACLYFSKNDKLSASNSLKDAEKLYDKYQGQLSEDVTLALAKSYSHLQKEEKSETILKQLVEEHGTNNELMNQVDKFVEDPLSEQGKKRTQEIIKTGISYYNSEDYMSAIIEFTTALNNYPKHVGIKLNLAQALIMSFMSDNVKLPHLNRAKKILEELEDLGRQHPHFSRLVSIRDKVREADQILKKK